MYELEIIKNLATIIATIIASYVAITGLDAWRKQLKGKTDYELARRYLRAIYKIRESIKEVRNPFISIEEIFIALSESGLSEEEHSNSRKSNRAVYSKRWKKVMESKNELDIELLEAEVSWGKNSTIISKDLNDLIRKLYVGIKMFLEYPENRLDRDILYDIGEEDIFNKEVDTAIQKIENYLKVYLK